MKCAECKTIADCKQAFGKYWPEKSSNGTGCEHPFAYDRPKRKVLPPRPPVKRFNGNKTFF